MPVIREKFVMQRTKAAQKRHYEKKARTKAGKIHGIRKTTLSRFQAVIGLVYRVVLVLLVLFNSLSRQPFFNGAANKIGCIVLDKMTGLRNCE
jgi:hypothetical protein